MIAKRPYRYKNIKEMEMVLSEIWPKISKESLKRLNTSIPHRIAACIKNKRGSIIIEGKRHFSIFFI